MAALPWNQWQDSPGIGGSFGVEYAGISVAFTSDHELGTVGAYVFQLGWRRDAGDKDRRWYAELHGGIGDRYAMIAA